LAGKQLLRRQADAVDVEQRAIGVEQDGSGLERNGKAAFLHVATLFDTYVLINIKIILLFMTKGMQSH
jgi:hypothetical protein